ncbi:hypothetical protein [Allomesorhizobium camelthorni]|uniref:DUF1849 family protein n=1 Tax=Allomesorhizobium camelthorni TaxID=475069 RepID=A0A6G4W840_9HYPH|nr:hypothetical protein [Mesorhizobium camelthorni]NGO50403.1 hypothetical protein [Mesorhizobium camelthorni]
MKRAIVAALGAVSIFGGSASLAEELCTGNTRQHHPLGEYDFSTNSRVEEDGEFWKYIACVQNNSTEYWLRLSWFIPLIGDRWVPPGEHLEQSRLSNDADARPILACIEYGNLKQKAVAQLLGDAQDEKKSSNPDEVGCRRSLGFDAAPTEKAVELPSDGLMEETRLFVPSDIKDPANSMLEVNVSYGIKPGTNGYESYFVYNATPYQGSSNANPDLIRIKPRFSPKAQYLLNAFSGQVSKDYLQVAKEGSFSFGVSGAAKWEIEPAFYDFVDQDGNVLTSLHVPLFSPAGTN